MNYIGESSAHYRREDKGTLGVNKGSQAPQDSSDLDS